MTKRYSVVSSDGVAWSNHSTAELATKAMRRWMLKCSENPELRTLTFSVIEA